MKDNFPDYSVALCTFNGEKYIEEQLNSILGQTVLPREIVISDDGSEDDTMKIVNEIARESVAPIRSFVNYGKHGVSGNFFTAIRMYRERCFYIRSG